MKTASVTFDVVGLKHRVLPETMNKLDVLVNAKPVKCSLEREPSNPYDPYAIKVVTDDKRVGDRFHIGYIRRATAKVVAHGMDDRTLQVKRCHLVYINRHGWGRVAIEFLKSPANKPKN